MIKISIIAHDIRSSHNIGSLLRTAEGLGIEQIFLTGYTPYPLMEDDDRLPHIALKNNNKIAKTALGAEKSNIWKYHENVYSLIIELKKQGQIICALEQNSKALQLPTFKSSKDLVLILGSEVTGINNELLKYCDHILEIPMFGNKESFNVVEAATMAMYQFKFHS